jgi:hypothetical protein
MYVECIKELKEEKIDIHLDMRRAQKTRLLFVTPTACAPL